eukprot:TRINITY_DN80436_c0_g1_i1.p2 TRINITY_DN80436_c0_g1~~TRINITY_DN80436_c0_g1_i1.p2  ORF type:complete len:365 (-),score=65.26 TRINITY_DN80436_c0_g1_i1:90-1184(-)
MSELAHRPVRDDACARSYWATPVRPDGWYAPGSTVERNALAELLASTHRDKCFDPVQEGIRTCTPTPSFSQRWRRCKGLDDLDDDVGGAGVARVRRSTGMTSSKHALVIERMSDEKLVAAIWDACKSGEEDFLEEVARRRSHVWKLFTVSNRHGSTPLHMAALHGHAGVCQLLCEFGVEPNMKDKRGWTPLTEACVAPCFSVAVVLLRRKANPESRDNAGRSVFHHACCCNDPEVPALLLEYQPSLNSLTDGQGRTGLHYAALSPHDEVRLTIVLTLLEKFAKPDIQDACGLTALQYLPRPMGGHGQERDEDYRETRLAAEVVSLIQSGGDVEDFLRYRRAEPTKRYYRRFEDLPAHVQVVGRG